MLDVHAHCSAFNGIESLIQRRLIINEITIFFILDHSQGREPHQECLNDDQHVELRREGLLKLHFISKLAKKPLHRR